MKRLLTILSVTAVLVFGVGTVPAAQASETPTVTHVDTWSQNETGTSPIVGVSDLREYVEATNAETGQVVKIPLSSRLYTDCANGTGCLWDNQNGMGNILTIAFSVHGYNCWNLARPQAPLMSNNDMESGRVDYGAGDGSGQDLRVFDGANCSTSTFECQLFNGYNYTYGPLHDCSNMASSFRIANL